MIDIECEPEFIMSEIANLPSVVRRDGKKFLMNTAFPSKKYGEL